MCVCVSVCSVLRYCLNVFLPQSRMSTIFKDSESFGKKNGNKWSLIWQLLLMKGEIAAQKKVGFGANFALLSRIFWYQCFSFRLTVFFPPPLEVQCKKKWLSEYLGKINGKKWSQIEKLLLIKGVKLPRWKKFFTYFFISSLSLNNFRIPWGKVMERSGLRFETLCS